MISCLSIIGTGATTSSAIDLSPTTANQTIVVRNVRLTAQSVTGYGIRSSASGTTVIVDHVTVSGYGTNVYLTGLTSARVSNSLISGGRTGISIAGSVSAAHNYITQTTLQCELVISSVGRGQVTGDSCVDVAGAGFQLTGNGLGLDATGLKATNVAGSGISITGAVTLKSATVEGATTGIFMGSALGAKVLDNTSRANSGAGIDLGGCRGCLISNNTIIDNGGPAITGNPAYTGGPALTSNNDIFNNHISGNSNGIVFLGLNVGNRVWATDWMDGRQSFNDLEQTNTLVDAGSSKVGSAGLAVLFSDYLARVNVGHAPGEPTIQQAAVATEVVWDFGDGSAPHSVVDPTQGHGPPPQVTHAYAEPGTYVATVTVSYVAQDTTTVLNDTVSVEVF